MKKTILFAATAALFVGCSSTQNCSQKESAVPALVNFQVIEQPEVCVVGKLIHLNQVDFSAGAKLWEQCFADGTFATLEALKEYIHEDAYVGYMDEYNPTSGEFNYLCGMIMKPGVPVPEGFTARTLPATKIGVAWIKGKQGQVSEICTAAYNLTPAAIVQKGMKMAGNWTMEVYTCPRFTTPDENGDIIIDFYMPCK